MDLKNKIADDMKTAMKSKDTEKVSVLRMLNSQIKNKQIETKKELSDDEILEIVAKQIKQRQDSIKEYKSGNRNDLVQKEENEIKILKPYLPEQLNDDEIKKIINSVIKQTNAQDMSDMGKVMQEVLAKTKGRADNSKIAQFVKSQLQR